MNIRNLLEGSLGRMLMLSAISFSIVLSCDTYEYDDTEIWDAISELQHKLDSLEQHVAANVSAIQSMVSLGSIKAWDYDAATGKGVITLLDGKTITVDQTFKGYSLITVVKGDDGKYYWATCKDGVSELLMVDGKKVPVTVTPALKISEDNEWMISVDGGVTWVSTGITYVEQTAGNDPGTGEGPGTQVSFFKNVEQIDDILVLTLEDGTVVKVSIIGEASMTVSSETLWFSRHGMEKSVTVEMINVKAYTITEKPEGWKARIEDDSYLFVTSPDNFVDFADHGTVKILALYNDGRPNILSVNVQYEPPFRLSFVNGEISVVMSENTASDYNGYVIAGWKASDYSDEDAVEWLNSNNENLVALQGTESYLPADVIEGYSENDDYVVVAVPYLPVLQVAGGSIRYEISDLQKVNISGEKADFEISDIRFDGAMLNALIDIPEYYGGFMELEDWNNYGRDNFLETLEKGGAVSVSISQYSGPANGFPDGEIVVNINPAVEYVIWYIPVKEHGKYDEDDFVTYTFTTPDVYKGQSMTAPTYELKEVSSSGCMADVTPASGAYKTYAAIVKSSVIPEDEKDVVKYLIALDHYSDGSAVNTVSNWSVSSADEVWLLAVSVDEGGHYGELLKRKVEINTLKFTDALGVEVTEIEHGIGDVSLSLSFKGSPVEMTYFTSTFTYYDDETIQNMLALEQYGDASSIEIDKFDGSLEISGLTIGAEYIFYAVVRDAEGNCSKLYKYDFIPVMSIDYILSDSADYEYGMPVLTGTKKGMANYTLTLDVEMPDECVKYWLYRGDPEYFTGDPWTDSDKLVSGSLMGVTVHTESETGLVYEFMNAASRIYMVWQDANGEFHAILEYNPN